MRLLILICFIGQHTVLLESNNIDQKLNNRTLSFILFLVCVLYFNWTFYDL